MQMCGKRFYWFSFAMMMVMSFMEIECNGHGFFFLMLVVDWFRGEIGGKRYHDFD